MGSPIGAGSGAGGAGNLGAPLSPTQRDIEATAWTEVRKAALGIVNDSVEIAFSQLDQRYSTSHLGTQTGYRAREDQPLLDHTLENVRVLQSQDLPIDESWNSTYEQLISQLPPEMLARFKLEQQKPPNEQDPSFVATANVLKRGAQILTTISVHCQSPDPNSLEAARTNWNLDISTGAFIQAIKNTLQVADKAEEYLEEQGANLPHHDDYKNSITQIRSDAEILSRMDLKTLTDSKGEGAP